MGCVIKRPLGAAIAALCLLMLPLAALADARSGWLWPVPSYKYMSRGYFTQPSLHEGIDIPVGTGTDVYAAKDGAVVIIYGGCNQASPNSGDHKSCSLNTCNPYIEKVNWHVGGDAVYKFGQIENFGSWSNCNYGYGRGVVIYHPEDNTVSAYAHLSSIDVACGQPVKQGDKIGKSGAYGNAWGAHLHFEIGVNP